MVAVDLSQNVDADAAGPCWSRCTSPREGAVRSSSTEARSLWIRQTPFDECVGCATLTIAEVLGRGQAAADGAQFQREEFAMAFLAGFRRLVEKYFPGPVQPGHAVGVHKGRGRVAQWGTFGCIVRVPKSEWYLLTADHVVLQHTDHVVYHVLSSARTDSRGRRQPELGRPVATIGHDHDRLASLDCVVAELNFRTRVKPKFPRPIGQISDDVVRVNEWQFTNNEVEVQMWGARSGHCRGYSAVGMDYQIDAHAGRAAIEPPLIEISPDHRTHLEFCDRGDSGALVVTVPPKGERPRPVGILIAKSEQKFLTVGYAMPMERIMKALGPEAEIITR